jgi:cyclic pyranopterin phosphate synthase
MMHVYRFEEIGEELDLVPLAARRALDVAGLHVSLADWRKAPIELRRALAWLGSDPVVDMEAVHATLEDAGVLSQDVPAVGDPTRDDVPSELAGKVGLVTWSVLGGLDRYSLVKVAHSKRADETLPKALAEIVPLSTHVDARTGAAHMVDVGPKEVTARRALARGRVTMEPSTAARLRAGDVAKGDVLATARIAGIQAAKRTPDLIPLCHAIALTRVIVDFVIEDRAVAIEAIAEARDRTGVEMEALTAAGVAALTIYDMLKGIDRGMRIEVHLEEKIGGKSGRWTREQP